MAPSDGVRVPDRGSAVQDESGAIILMAALILLVMLGMSAVVVDLAFMRHDKRASQTAADMGAVAGAFALPVTPHADSSGLPACQDAWAYVVRNSPIPEGTGGDPCLDPERGDFTSGCTNDADPLPDNVAVAEVDPYRVTITWPVPASMVSAQQDDAAERPCELVAVQVDRTRGLFFAGIWGLSEGFTTAPAVASMSPDHATGIPALLVLDRHGCLALRAEGQGKVWVEYFEAINEIDSDGDPVFDEDGHRKGEGQPVFDDDGYIIRYEDAPGLIGVDSSARDCGSNEYAMDAGTGNAEIKAGVDEDGDPVYDEDTDRAEGDIWIYALAGQHAAKAHRTSAVTDGRVSPEPTSMFAPITRAPVDHRYNCDVNYDIRPEFAKHPGVANCTNGSEAFIDQLRAAYGESGTGPAGTIDYHAYMASVYGEGFAGGDPCHLEDVGVVHLDPANVDADDSAGWWVNCTNGLTVLDDLVISGGDVVFEGGVRTGSSGGVWINYDLDAGELEPREGEGQDVVVYLRSGDLRKGAQSTMAFHRSAVYIHDGRINLGGGAQHGELAWTAPDDGPYEGLALWSESEKLHEMEGQGDLTLQGVFFAPNARMEFTGKGGQVNHANAQFLSYRLTMKGQGALLLRPDPAALITIPRPRPELIR